MVDKIPDDVKQKILSPLDQKKLIFSGVTNSSRAERVVKALLGPEARVWQRGGMCSVGMELGEGKQEVYGTGPTFVEALLDAARELTPDEIMKEAGPELRATLSADSRKPKPLRFP